MSRLGFGRAPGRTIRTAGPPPAEMLRSGLGAPSPSSITVRAANDLDQWYAQRGCTGCDDMGSDLRVRTLAFKAAVLLDPATTDSVSLNVSTPLAQSGFGPGTDAALSLVLGAQRQSQGHCTDDNGYCTVGGMQTPQVPLELQTIANALGVSISTMLQQAKQVPQTDATLKLFVEQVVAAFRAFTDQLKAALGNKEQPLPPPTPPSPAVPPPQSVVPLTQPAIVKTSNIGLALGVVGIALVALGTGAVIMTAAKNRKAKKR